MNLPQSREIAIEPRRAARLLIDVQNFNCRQEGGDYAHLDAAVKRDRIQCIASSNSGRQRHTPANTSITVFISRDSRFTAASKDVHTQPAFSGATLGATLTSTQSRSFLHQDVS
jgi:hypothetical protein